MRPLSSANRISATTALIYLVVAVLWIWFSDQATYALFGDARTVSKVQTVKGWLFVSFSSLLIFFISHRAIRRYERERNSFQANERFLASIFRAAPTGIGMVRSRIILTANDQLCAMTGYTAEELIGRSARILYPSDAEYETVGTDKYRQIDRSGTGTVETRWQRKDGVLIDVLLSSTPIQVGNLEAGVTFTAVDITASKQAEMAVRASEERYRGLIELAVDGILLTTHEGIITESNSSMCAMLGMERASLIDRHLGALPFTPESVAKTPFRLELLHRSEIVLSERDLVRPDGSLISVEMRTKMMPDGSCQSIFRDITERKRTEQALRESREKFALAFAHVPDSINITRLSDGVFVETSKSFTGMTGYTREEVIGKTSLELNMWHDPADRQRVFEAMQTYGCCDNLEAVFRRKDGDLRTGLLSARLLMLNDEPHIISITRDISQLKQAEADLHRLKVAIEQAGEVIVITDTAGNIQYANPAFTRITGYTVEEVLLHNPRILKSGEHDEAFYRGMWQTITSGRTWTGRLVNRKKDGSLYTEEATISPVFDPQGVIVNFVAIKRDISAQLKLEAQYRQAQKMESVGRLTGGVAHDFNNILAVIIGYAEMALEKTDPGQMVHADLKKIHEAALRSTDIVRQLLAYSRKQHITPRTMDLNRVVAGILQMLRRLIGEDIELVWIPNPVLPPIKMDPAQIDQILANLCVNARDAIDETGTITIRTGRVFLDEARCAEHPGAEPGDYVVLTVADNGCGMEPELLDKIFEPFFTTKELLGTGLGLATVYGIVQQNAGIIEVASTPGQGTTFSIHLPVPTDGIVQEKHDQAGLTAPGHGETILLVEDDPGILGLGRSMLKKLGYSPLTASSPEAALQLAERHDWIDLLITDVIMPGMNGKELADRLSAMHPGLRILYMSGYTADVIAHHGVLDGRMQFLQKPFTLKGLAEKIRTTLDG
ncbi:hybrid sensor histidine kinase/response regulator [Desulfobulbus elongatus]|uniref:hybrid sensor histidine kinase/response regulator n=1 Tax=Desulfobulbus elongatus TaxID=53332 RepID=UPI00068689A6|nr:PAS domain S-box protein [Desulfobulbus elongatus]